MDNLLNDDGMVDAFRVVNEQADEYTWWTYRAGAFSRNVGWRIDYQMISADMRNRVLDASIHKTQQYSDHAPLIIEYSGELHA